VKSARRRWAAGVLLVTAGWFASPHAVPVYDGVGAPDEPYRYVAPPAGATRTAAATTAVGRSPVKDGRSAIGLSVLTAEMGPQFSLFLPPKGLAATGSTVTVQAVPVAPTDQPSPARIDGNVYAVTLTAPAGPVTLTDQAALATLAMRATTQKQPPPVMQYRADATSPWRALETARGGLDVYYASFVGAGQYALAFAPAAQAGGGPPVLPMVLLGVLAVLVVAVVAIRLRARTP
jgi:hypothetical protein